MVPEDAPLFSGNLRQNLDINGKATDADLWKILEEVSNCENLTRGSFLTSK